MPTKAEIAARIKEGTRKRNEDQRRKQQLQKEFLADVRGQTTDSSQQGPSRYISCIFVTLLFISFPLSERVVDWTLVAFFVALNLFWVIVLRDPSDWLNVLTMILSNLLLARWSSDIYEIPAKLASAPKGLLLGYTLGNIVFAAVTYYCYVERNWFRERKPKPDAAPKSSRSNEDKPVNGVDAEELEMYIQRREKSARADWAVCGFVVCNVAALIVTGIIPTEVVARVAQGCMRLLQ